MMQLFGSNVTEGAVSFTALWEEIQAMMHNLDQMGSVTASSWADLFSIGDVVTGLMNNHSREWEPVLDMLNENYLGSR